MEGLLGKITGIAAREDGAGRHHLTIRCTPACLLPTRQAPPEWLHETELTVERTVADPREVGGIGDSIILNAAESARYLHPLAVTPAITYGALPATLCLSLCWWENEEPPPFCVQANGRCVRGLFPRTDEGFVAEVSTDAFFPTAPALPVEFTVTCGALRATATVLPAGAPLVRGLALLEGMAYRLENSWYSIDVVAHSGGGAIFAWREPARHFDHFQRPTNLICIPLHIAGHTDQLIMNWSMELGCTPSETMTALALDNVGVWRESAASRLTMAGPADRALHLRTSVDCTLLDALPLLLWRRGYQFERESAAEIKPPTPQEPIDTTTSFGYGFRAAWIAERQATFGSRILSADADRLVVLRNLQSHRRFTGNGWRLHSGWALVEHPGRRACMLYLFDQYHAPELVSWTTPTSLTLEPVWPLLVAHAGDALAFTLAISAGECCGAAATGAWVGCRTPLPGGGIRCAIIARLRNQAAGQASFTLGELRQEVALRQCELPGVGAVVSALADFSEGAMAQPLDIIVADIPQRRMA